MDVLVGTFTTSGEVEVASGRFSTHWIKACMRISPREASALPSDTPECSAPAHLSSRDSLWLSWTLLLWLSIEQTPPLDSFRGRKAQPLPTALQGYTVDNPSSPNLEQVRETDLLTLDPDLPAPDPQHTSTHHVSTAPDASPSSPYPQGMDYPGSPPPFPDSDPIWKANLSVGNQGASFPVGTISMMLSIREQGLAFLPPPLPK